MQPEAKDELLRQIAAHLPDFQLKAPADGRPSYLAGPDGMEIWINAGRERGKLHIFGHWPMDGNKHMSPRSWGAVAYNESQDISIHVGADRPPEVIAREITRRFLPRYRELYSKCIERKAQNDSAKNAAYDRVRALAKQAGEPCPHADQDRSEYSFHLGRIESEGWYGDVRVGSSYVYIDLRSLPLEKAMRVLAALREPSHPQR